MIDIVFVLNLLQGFYITFSYDSAYDIIHVVCPLMDVFDHSSDLVDTDVKLL